MTTGLGIMQDASGNGVDPLTHRKCIQARWGNTGIVTGLDVTGRSDLRYNVAAGVAVTCRSESDGYAEAYWPGGQTPAVSAGNASNPRIDLVWIKANDLQQGDDDNQVHVGVTSGTPSASPVPPACPAGCTPVAYMRFPANATSTSGASKTGGDDAAIPYASTLGLLGENVNTADMIGDSTERLWFYENPVTFTVPTKRLVEMIYSCTFTNALSDGTIGNMFNGVKPIVWGVASFQIDGEDVPHSGTEWQASNGVWEDHQVSCIIEVAAGTHTVRVRNGLMAHGDATGAPYFRCSANNGVEYKGRTLRVWDRGIA